MRKVITLAATLITLMFASGEAHQPQVLFNGTDNPDTTLRAMLQLLGMKGASTLTEIDDWAQLHLLRRGERWEPQSDRFEAQRPQLWPLLTELGFTNELPPSSKFYQGAIVHGARASAVKLRLRYLIDQWDRGIRFKTLYFLGGERTLNPSLECFPGATTESEMIRIIWREAVVPQEMRNEVTVHFIEAGKKKNALRATFREPIEAWLSSSPSPGSYLSISNSPHIPRLHLLLQLLIPANISVETAGPAASKEIKLAIILDEVARTIHTLREGKSSLLKN